MFPGMMRGPEPLPDHVAHQQYWSQITRFVTFTTATIIVALTVRHAERQAYESMVKSL
jgi:hypothetical protein